MFVLAVAAPVIIFKYSPSAERSPSLSPAECSSSVESNPYIAVSGLFVGGCVSSPVFCLVCSTITVQMLPHPGHGPPPPSPPPPCQPLRPLMPWQEDARCVIRRRQAQRQAQHQAQRPVRSAAYIARARRHAADRRARRNTENPPPQPTPCLHQI